MTVNDKNKVKRESLGLFRRAIPMMCHPAEGRIDEWEDSGHFGE